MPDPRGRHMMDEMMNEWADANLCQCQACEAWLSLKVAADWEGKALGNSLCAVCSLDAGL